MGGGRAVPANKANPEPQAELSANREQAKERGRARVHSPKAMCCGTPSRQRWCSSLSNDTILEAVHFRKLLSFAFVHKSNF